MATINKMRLTRSVDEQNPARELARTLNIRPEQVQVVIKLLDEGATIPFIARYRQDQTGGLDDVKLRELRNELTALRNLYAKREETANLLQNHGNLTPDLLQRLEAANSLKQIEDIYRPFRPKRRTRASDASDAGLRPLAELLRNPCSTQKDLEAAYLSWRQKNDDKTAYLNSEAALQGARDILAEELSDDANVRACLRRQLTEHGEFTVKPKRRTKGEEQDPAKVELYKQYADFNQPVKLMKGYQILAINRGEREGYLSPKIDTETEQAEALVCTRLQHQSGGKPSDSWLSAQQKLIASDAWSRLLRPSLENELRADLKARAEDEALDLFAKNLHNMLLAPPLRGYTVLALDPGYRNGCKVAVTDPQGNVLETTHIYPVQPQNQIEKSRTVLNSAVKKHRVDVIALGNGTATRETEAFVKDWQQSNNEITDLPLVIVNEAGASVYSASAVGATEFPDMAVELRSAISLARRLQDPLAELVKIEPASLGVGQYQHDLDQTKLGNRLDEVVEDCVNKVGADLNTASQPLLSHISGINAGIASNICKHREKIGRFTSRQQLLDVPRLGPKTYEQCAGFLRVPGGKEPLDNTAVHPESYTATRKLIACLLPADKANKAKNALADGEGLDLSAEVKRFGSETLQQKLDIGPATLRQILEDLGKAGRDDRKDYEFPTRSAHIQEISDLKSDMIIKGVVRSVVAFGAFVDLGVHQDGLVHISELADHFVKDPTSEVQVGQTVTVRVLDVDIKKQRIALSMKGLSKRHESG